MMRSLKIILTGAALALAASATAGDVAAGKKSAEACAACHGADGKGISDEFPNLAGQYEDYLRVALKQYRSGERANGVMGAFATNLTDEEIANLAAYYASMSGLDILPVK